MTVDFRVYLITDRRMTSDGDLPGAVTKALEGGVRAVQLREKDLPARDLFLLATELRKRTAEYGARLFINDRADVARAVGAEGVHLGVRSIPPREARRLLGPKAVIGCSTHNALEVRQARDGGADFVTFGPVYPTPSKDPFGPPAGVPALADACRTAGIPVFALGGIRPGNLEEVAQAGCFGIALISGILAAADPRAAAALLTEYFVRGPLRAEAEREGAS